MRKLFISFFALWMLAGSLHAETVWYAYNKRDKVWPSANEACVYAVLPDTGGRTWGAVRADGMYDCVYLKDGNYYYRSNAMPAPVADCPAGQVRQFPALTCGAPSGPKCAVPAGKEITWTSAAGTAKKPGATNADKETDNKYPESSPTCGLDGLPDVVSCYSKPNAAGGTSFFCTYKGTSNGQDAPAGAPEASGEPRDSSSKDAQETAPPDSSGKCPGGTVQVGISASGVPMCVGTGTNPGTGKATQPTSTTTKGTDAAGNSTETTKTERTNEDGSTTTTTTTTTTAPDGTRTVTGSTTTSQLANGTQGQEDKPTDDFCRQHPELNVCRNSSVAGTCGTISCQGDAIQCATLRAAAAMQCAQDADKKALEASAQKTLGDAILGGNDPQKAAIDAAIKGTEIDLSKPQLDQTGFLGGGSCLANKTMTVMGKTVTVDFSRICSDIQPLRAVIMAVAFIAAYMIVSRSVLSA